VDDGLVTRSKTPVTESGIFAFDLVALMHRYGVHTFLVGKTVMHADDPRAELVSVYKLD
jgi:indole-3-glycerol phosphate synthase